MKKRNQFALFLAKFLEISHWMAVALWAVLLTITLIFGSDVFEKTFLNGVFVTGAVQIEDARAYADNSLNVYGLEVTGTGEYPKVTWEREWDGTIEEYQFFSDTPVYHTDKIIIYSAGCLIIMTFMALIFRNIYLILKAANQPEKISPFHKDIVSRVRNIGLFLIGSSVVCTVTSIIANTGAICFNIQNIVLGVLVLCLAGYFHYGQSLEESVGELV